MDRDRDTAPSEHGDNEDGSDISKGWDTLQECTGGLAPESIEALVSIRELEPVYILLHALVGRNPRDFLVRAAVLESLVADGRSRFSADDMAEVLYWLEEENRRGVLRALRHSGWLSFDPEQGTSISDAGRWVHDVLSFLHKRMRESELLPTLAGIEYAMNIGLDPLRHLLSLRSRLIQLREDMDAARRSHSEVILRDAAKKLESSLDLSRQARAVLDRIPSENRQSRQVARDVHDLLSRLHGVASDLQASISQVGRQYLHLTAGLTTEQIVRALRRENQEDLAAAMRKALLPAFIPPPLLTLEAVVSAAEYHILRERVETEPVRWVEPPEPPKTEEAMEIPAEVQEFLSDIAGIVAAEEPAQMAEFVPRDAPAVSFLRASLLSLVGEGRTGEGVAGRIGAAAVALETPGDGWPEPLLGKALARLTPGRLRKRGEAPE